MMPHSSTNTPKPIIHFAHANGIVAKTYQTLFDNLADDFDIVYIPTLGNHPDYPVDNHWQKITAQIISNIEQTLAQSGQTQVIGMGHSLGALCTLQAAYQRPELFSQIVLFDPPLIAGFSSFVLHLSKLFARIKDTRFVDKITPAGLSSKRRDVWQNREHARKALGSKPFYQVFDPRCFDDYLQYGLSTRADGKVTLTIPKSVEVAVFRNNPSLYWLKPNHPPLMPAKILYGADSAFTKRGFPQIIKQRMGINYEITAGGHMFPLQYPDAIAARVKAIIQENR